MHKLIVTTGNKSYCVFGETLDKKDYPTIEVGSTVFIPNLEKVFLVTDINTFTEVTESKENASPDKPNEEVIPKNSENEDISKEG